MSERRKSPNILTWWKEKKNISIVLALALLALVVFNNVGKVRTDRSDEMLEARKPIIVQFPLRGEWLSPNTPETKIPSHGTNQLGTRYAYDFIQVAWERKGIPAYRVSLPQYLLNGVALNEYYCWGQEIYAPCDGIVVKAEDGYNERERTKLFSDMANAYKNANYFDPKKDDVQTVAGNYIIIKYSDNIYAAFCHLQTGSIQVSVGQQVKKYVSYQRARRKDPEPITNENFTHGCRLFSFQITASTKRLLTNCNY